MWIITLKTTLLDKLIITSIPATRNISFLLFYYPHTCYRSTEEFLGLCQPSFTISFDLNKNVYFVDLQSFLKFQVSKPCFSLIHQSLFHEITYLMILIRDRKLPNSLVKVFITDTSCTVAKQCIHVILP